MTANSWYRRSLFNYKGNREYTRTGYEAASVRFVEKDLDVDCSERHYMITGSNSGIGLQTALEIARRGGVIHMVCRNQESAARARSEIITTTGNDKIHLHIVDLAKPREVILWAQRFAAQHEKLHVLIHNAGCLVHERKIDEDGVEYNFAVNTLAPHILTLTFMPILEKNEESRVIMVSSAGLLCVRLDPHDLMHENLNPFLGTLAYSQNKRQQVVMALWYAQRYSKVHFSSMHPGWADTPAVRTSIPQFYEMMKDNLRTPAQGADTVVWLAISKAAPEQPSGLFFQDREPVSSHLPLAWTKSSIEEEDFLMTNIQNVYTKIYNKLFNADGTLIPSPDPPASSSTPPAPEPSKEENENTESAEHRKEHPLAPEPVTYPVIPPPPPSAEKVTFVKSEVQEVAEIHVPPPSSNLKENITAGSKESPTEVKENASAEVKKDATLESKENVTTEIKESATEIKGDSTEVKESATEVKESATEVKESATEVKKESATEVKKESATEVKKESATEVKKESATEIKKESATEIKKESATEVKKESATEIKESATEIKESATEIKESATEIKESATETKENTTETKENTTETKENVSEKPNQDLKIDSPATETKMDLPEDTTSVPSSPDQEKEKTDSHKADYSSAPSVDRLPEP